MNFSARPTDAMLVKYTPLPTSKTPNPQPDCGTIWVEFNGDTSVGIKQLRTFAHHITAHNFHTGIFVSSVNITPSALKIIPSVLPSVIETFHEQDLLVNITKHELVPKHVLLSGEEKKALLERYRVKESQLPRIQVGDPVVSVRNDVIEALLTRIVEILGSTAWTDCQNYTPIGHFWALRIVSDGHLNCSPCVES